jgi:hypothetical protein
LAPIFFAASVAAFAALGKLLVVTAPRSPIRP